eukprot:TRINITY_DN1843_c0_g1_i2.p2 TRINITY_DN1843_c0_g1~~TRINITY_DN1843_c0_g1_i2.p2  ORF type:complete len:325 (-),score=5.75 TRINITY_DN1843_c0_g1_i2:211-1185(-)
MNITLDGMEAAVMDEIKRNFKTAPENWIRVIRFADDGVILCDSYAAAQIVIRALTKFMARFSLQLNTDKTKITNWFYTPFNFVGFQILSNYKNNKRTTLSLIPPKKLKSFKQKIKNKIKPITSTTELFLTVNEMVILGFCNFYRYASASNQFGNLNTFLAKVISNKLFKIYLNQPTRRRQTLKLSKSAKITQKQAIAAITRNHWKLKHRGKRKAKKRSRWLPQWTLLKNQYIRRTSRLADPSPMMIIAHPKTHKMGLSAFHPEDHEKLIKKAISYKYGLARELFRKNKAKCAYCKDDLLLNDNYELHHKLPHSMGGQLKLSNMA